MLGKLITLVLAFGLMIFAGYAAAVEVNTADEAALESVKGIGPAHAKAIIDERTKHGPFKDANDLAARVKGIGQKSVAKLEAAGLTINSSRAPASGNAVTSRSAAEGTSGPSIESNPAAKQSAPAAAPGGPTPASELGQTKNSKKSRKNTAKSASSASGG